MSRASERHLAWPRSFGLLPTLEAERRHIQGRYPDLAGRFHPTARGAELDLAIDQMSWFFIFDDQFDGKRGRHPGHARELIDAVLAVLGGTRDLVRTSTTELVSSFADLWARSRVGMSDSWSVRAADSWRRYLEGHVVEARDRTGVPPGMDEQLAVRRETSGVYPILDLAERIGGYEVPEPAVDSPFLRALRDLAAEVVVFDNEIISLEKEEALGDNNLVLTYERAHGCSRSESISAVTALLAQRTEHLLALEAELPDFCAGLALDRAGTKAVHRYQYDAIRTVMRGAHDWQQGSDRYSSAYLPLSATLL